MPQKIDLWITVGSTYSYLTANRAQDMAEAAGVTLHLRPFYLGRIFREMGFWPFHPDTPKMRYMWRDIARKSADRGLSPNLPAPYPAPQTDRANRVLQACINRGEGFAWLKASYVAWFENGMLPGEDDHLTASLSAAGLPVDALLQESESAPIEDALVASTEAAKAAGVFGAPTFLVGDELFWGDDRLQDALAWAKRA